MLVAIILTRCLTGGPNVKPTVVLTTAYKHHITLSPTTMGTCVFVVFSELLLVFWFCCCFHFNQVYCCFVEWNSAVHWFCCCFNFNRVYCCFVECNSVMLYYFYLIIVLLFCYSFSLFLFLFSFPLLFWSQLLITHIS